MEPTHDIPAEVALAAQTRILSKIEKATPPEGFGEPCWIAPTAKGWSYSRTTFKALPGAGARGIWLTHRLAYTAWHGPIPDGYHVDHVCNIRACVNPAHLEAVTQAENNRRIFERSNGDRCARGHVRTPENTGINSKGRYCRICWNDRERERYAAKKAGTWKPKPTPRERFMQYVELGPTGCWLWIGAKTATGYGKFGLNGRTMQAHRASYELFVGTIPDGLTIDHLCANPLCVAPHHFEPVTMAENNRRSTSPSALAARKTECVNGHPLSGENLYTSPDGVRTCRTCKRARYERKKADPEYRAEHAAYMRARRARKKAERAAEGVAS